MVGVTEMGGKELKSIPMASSFGSGAGGEDDNEDTMLAPFLLSN